MRTTICKSANPRLGTLMSALALLLLTLFSQASEAVLLEIDPARSEVLYTPNSPFPICTVDQFGGIDCPPPAPPQAFAIAGNVDANAIHEHWQFGFGYPDVERDLLNLITSNLTSEALDLGLSLSGDLGLMSGESFEIQDNPCFLFVGPGSCSGWVTGPRTGSEGTWDGQTLVWRGFQTSYDASFNYTITATVAAVPEPGTLWLMLLLPALMFFRRGEGQYRSVPAIGRRRIDR
ncbi:hypothetical protein Tbd_1073 [Thiobacillus denitrificans ATCC 25259]|uniref:PEP-CTERM protein-sorting domain-containing protein n=2 Tax=Thiobacillus denitrificans TaxID=36861 RepID=Q3SJX3_THIDA|nr:hypothetical protein Tbd_1073 [Thiobacillus denitrificans ATCC 25259]